MESLRGGDGRGGAPNLAYSLRCSTKVPPTKVGFFYRDTPGVGGAFCLVEDAVHIYFLPYLFRRATAKPPTRGSTYLTVKYVWLAFSNPTLSASEKCTSSCVIKAHLVAALQVST